MQGMSAGNSLGAATDRVVTLNERLNKTLDAMTYQCERIEAVLARVNGTPSKIESAAKGANNPRPTLSMQATVENIEQVTNRLIELTGGVERIA